MFHYLLPLLLTALLLTGCTAQHWQAFGAGVATGAAVTGLVVAGAAVAVLSQPVYVPAPVVYTPVYVPVYPRYGYRCHGYGRYRHCY